MRRAGLTVLAATIVVGVLMCSVLFNIRDYNQPEGPVQQLAISSRKLASSLTASETPDGKRVWRGRFSKVLPVLIETSTPMKGMPIRLAFSDRN